MTQAGGTAVQAAEPAATQLTISPSAGLSVSPGTTTTVSATLANSGPGSASQASLALKAPSGWTVTPTTATSAASVTAGSSLTASWSVTAPSGSGPAETATLSATASYTDDATATPKTVTAQQTPEPEITSVSPSTASAGQVVTIQGTNFGAGQGENYITFSDEGTNWGAPQDAAAFTLNNWSDNQITFTVPPSSGTWHVVPGSTATVTVTTPGGTSNAATLTIGSG